MFRYPEFSDKLLDMAERIEEDLQPDFRKIELISEENQYKVLNAFRTHRISDIHFNSSSGYGYSEIGREQLEAVYADVFHSEDALVRSHVTGSPYDSLEMSVGIVSSPLSLAEYGVTFDYVDLTDDTSFDFEGIRAKIRPSTKVVAIQRSKGYKVRSTMSPEEIGEVVKFVKSIREDIIIFVDNCYGEFVDTTEPTDFGADLIAGSLIKNPGGGLAPIGGYLCGRADLIERCAFRLTAPGLGKEVGPSLGGVLKQYFQGLSIAPMVVANALKNAHFLAAMAEEMGFRTCPASHEKHHCIVQTVDMTDPEVLTKFCTELQGASFVDSFVRPEGADTPGYTDKVIMACGAFMEGSSIELSADGPMREPYTVYFQGGLSYEHGKYAILSAMNALMD